MFAGNAFSRLTALSCTGRRSFCSRGGGTCNVLESDTSYEMRKENDGAPMDIWRLDFTVRNSSGRWLDHLIGRYQIASEWPECTNWDVPDSGTTIVEWAGSIGHIQESGRNVVAPGQSLTDTTFMIVLRGDPEPRFSNWSVDFNFAANPPPAGTAASAPDRPLEERQPVAATAEREIRLDGPDCRNQPEGAQCWMELANQPGCYVWNPHRQPSETATWTGGCSAGLADGQGRLTWESPPDNRQEQDGMMRQGRPDGHLLTRDADGGRYEGPYVDGQRNGHWVVRLANGTVGEGPYVDGQRNGHWVVREANGTVGEGPFVDGQRNGHWVVRLANGTVGEGPYVDGQRNGHWVERYADGGRQEGPFVDGQRNGHWVTRQANGLVAEGPFVDGQRNGHWVTRQADGTVGEGPVVDGERHGRWLVRPVDGDTFYVTFVRGSPGAVAQRTPRIRHRPGSRGDSK